MVLCTQAVTDMPGLVDRIQRYISINGLFPGFLLYRLYRQCPGISLTGRNIAKPLLCKRLNGLRIYISCHTHNCVQRVVVLFKEGFYIIQLCVLYMRQFFTYGHPFVRMLFIDQFSHMLPGISIGLVDIVFFELFYHYLTLYFQALFTKGQGQHPVALEPEGRFYILFRDLYIVIGKIVRGIRIIFSTGHLQGFIIIGDVYRTAEHQVFKQVGKPGPVLVFISCANIVQYIHGHHGC